MSKKIPHSTKSKSKIDQNDPRKRYINKLQKIGTIALIVGAVSVFLGFFADSEWHKDFGILCIVSVVVWQAYWGYSIILAKKWGISEKAEMDEND